MREEKRGKHSKEYSREQQIPGSACAKTHYQSFGTKVRHVQIAYTVHPWGVRLLATVGVTAINMLYKIQQFTTNWEQTQGKRA